MYICCISRGVSSKNVNLRVTKYFVAMPLQNTMCTTTSTSSFLIRYAHKKTRSLVGTPRLPARGDPSCGRIYLFVLPHSNNVRAMYKNVNPPGGGIYATF
ncbi:MAG: hypothetical protein G01um10148_331 [Parcubacteria group bacterium Gr01-1014_8]|nr:MAG: hypothetical protein G01um10148_331 [Parcubacteria group bacterium Gr01-1014_8]